MQWWGWAGPLGWLVAPKPRAKADPAAFSGGIFSSSFATYARAYRKCDRIAWCFQKLPPAGRGRGWPSGPALPSNPDDVLNSSGFAQKQFAITLHGKASRDDALQRLWPELLEQTEITNRRF